MRKKYRYRKGSMTGSKGFAAIAYINFLLIFSGPSIVFAQLCDWIAEGSWGEWNISLMLDIFERLSGDSPLTKTGQLAASIGELPLWLVLPSIGGVGLSVLFGTAEWMDRHASD